MTKSGTQAKYLENLGIWYAHCSAPSYFSGVYRALR